MHATEASKNGKSTFWGRMLMYLCWLRSLIRFFVCSFCLLFVVLKIWTTFVERFILACIKILKRIAYGANFQSLIAVMPAILLKKHFAK